MPPFAMPKVPVTPVESGRPVAFVSVTAEGVPKFGVVKVGDVSRTTEPVPLQVNKDEVATAVTFPVAPVELPRIEFAAICARLVRETPFVAKDNVPAEPPTRAPRVPECEKAPESDKEVVATLWYADEPPYKSWPTGAVVVPVPPFAIPKVPVMSLARFTSEVETAPAVAFRNPESEPMLREPKNAFVDDAYEAETRVVDAFTTVSVSVEDA